MTKVTRRTWQTLSRRELIESALKSGVGGAALLQGLAGVPVFDPMRRLNHGFFGYDAYANIRHLFRPMPLLQLGEALAAGGDDAGSPILITIKIVNQIFTPLLFFLGPGSTLASGVASPLARAGAAAAMLEAGGARRKSAAFAGLPFNEWFANLLLNGTTDGRVADLNNVPVELRGKVKRFDTSKVAVQAFLGLRQILDGQNHALKGLKLAPDLPDLALFAADRILKSPLGIPTYMMGGQYDKAEGEVSANAVLGANGEAVVVPSFSVAAHADLVEQFVARNYLDFDLAKRFDELVTNPNLRLKMQDSLDGFRQSLAKLTAWKAFEGKPQTFVASQANAQSNRSSADHAFLAQVGYTLDCLDLPRLPFTVFSLMLNQVDADGNGLTATQNQTNVNQDAGGIAAYSYVEGARQLAIGLNMIAAKISAGAKIVVAAIAEGGRSTDMLDNRTSSALVIGPKGPGLLDDALYANALYGEVNEITSKPGDPAAALPSTTEVVLCSKSGLPDRSMPASTGHLQMGVARLLAEWAGVEAFQDLTEAQGRFIKLKRRST